MPALARHCAAVLVAALLIVAGVLYAVRATVVGLSFLPALNLQRPALAAAPPSGRRPRG
jgi:hypothetical protein